MTASKEALEALHAQVAEALAKRIASGEATAADLNVARSFLKDNNIEAVPVPGSPLGKLAEKVAEFPFDPAVDGLPN